MMKIMKIMKKIMNIMKARTTRSAVPDPNGFPGTPLGKGLATSARRFIDLLSSFANL